MQTGGLGWHFHGHHPAMIPIKRVSLCGFIFLQRDISSVVIQRSVEDEALLHMSYRCFLVTKSCIGLHTFSLVQIRQLQFVVSEKP